MNDRLSEEEFANIVAANPDLARRNPHLGRSRLASKSIPQTATTVRPEPESPEPAPKAEKARLRLLAAAMSEADLQASVIGLARLHRWKVAHFRSVRVQRKDGSTYWQTPVAADGEGFPDCILLKGKRALAWELKAERGSVTPKQMEWLDLFRHAGFESRVMKPSDWLSGAIERALAGLPEQ